MERRESGSKRYREGFFKFGNRELCFVCGFEDQHSLICPLSCLMIEIANPGSSNACKNCLENVANCIFLPCGHINGLCAVCNICTYVCTTCTNLVSGYVTYYSV